MEEEGGIDRYRSGPSDAAGVSIDVQSCCGLYTLLSEALGHPKGVILNYSFSKIFQTHSLLSHSEKTIVEVVSDPSFLTGTAAANLQDYL